MGDEVKEMTVTQLKNKMKDGTIIINTKTNQSITLDDLNLLADEKIKANVDEKIEIELPKQEVEMSLKDLQKEVKKGTIILNKDTNVRINEKELKKIKDKKYEALKVIKIVPEVRVVKPIGGG